MANRMIDARKLQKLVKEYRNEAPNATARKHICDVILSMLGDETQTPTVDAIEVVRCIQCKYWDVDTDTYGDGLGPEGTCFGICDGAGKTKYDDFCSYGDCKEKEG